MAHELLPPRFLDRLPNTSRKLYLSLLRDEPVRHRLLRALRILADGVPPPLRAA